MIQLEFKLEQQTPLLHFQHTQQGATLRATEVKPRFDRWLVQKVWNNQFQSCKTFLVGYDPNNPDALERKFAEGYRALNYKMRIVPGNDQSAQVAMKQNPAQRFFVRGFTSKCYPAFESQYIIFAQPLNTHATLFCCCHC